MAKMAVKLVVDMAFPDDLVEDDGPFYDLPAAPISQLKLILEAGCAVTGMAVSAMADRSALTADESGLRGVDAAFEVYSP